MEYAKLDVDRLKAEREKQNISLAEMAKMVGVDRSTLYRYERNIRNMDVEIFMKYIAALGYSSLDVPIFFVNVVSKRHKTEV